VNNVNSKLNPSAIRIRENMATSLEGFIGYTAQAGFVPI